MDTILMLEHDYAKLWGQKRAQLLAVLKVSVKEDENRRKEYEGYYMDSSAKAQVEGIKKGNYIQLVFIGEHGIPFSVLRPYSYSKWEGYRDLIGTYFQMLIKKERR